MSYPVFTVCAVQELTNHVESQVITTSDLVQVTMDGKVLGGGRTSFKLPSESGVIVSSNLRKSLALSYFGTMSPIYGICPFSSIPVFIKLDR